MIISILLSENTNKMQFQLHYLSVMPVKALRRMVSLVFGQEGVTEGAICFFLFCLSHTGVVVQ